MYCAQRYVSGSGKVKLINQLDCNHRRRNDRSRLVVGSDTWDVRQSFTELVREVSVCKTGRNESRTV